MTLKGKGAVVTGGGRGIGAATARALAEAGASVVVAARTSSEIEAVADELKGRGHLAWAVPCDVSQPESITAMAAIALKHLGHVDILVNNAGIAASAPVKSITIADWNRFLTVNATSAFLCTQAFLPAMVQRGWGRIVTIASVVAKTGAAYISAYTASKHAVLGFTRSVAAEVAKHGVTANAVCPGYVDTNLTKETIDRIMGKTGRSKEETLEFLKSANPQHRLIEPEEVAYCALFLCDERAKGINGQAIVLDGGGFLG